MRKALIGILALALVGCTAVQTGPDPMAGHGFRGVAHVKGDFDAQALAEAMPLTALIRASGNATITLRPFPLPLLTIDGDYTLTVEPTPGNEQAAIDAVVAGKILIRRDGQPGALNAPGSIRAFNAAARALKSYSLPMPSAVKQIAESLDDETEDECPNGLCHLDRKTTR